MKTINPVLLIILGLVFLIWSIASRIRKRIIRHCFVEVVVEKGGKKIPADRFPKGTVKKGSVKRCNCLRVKRRYTTILPPGETICFFARPEGKLRFRIRIYGVFKVICCECPDCKSVICLGTRNHDSISVIHGYWIMLKERIKLRLGIDYQSEFFPSGETSAAITEYGRVLRTGTYSLLDSKGTLPPTIISVATAAIEELLPE
jgi:hypothetical protein